MKLAIWLSCLVGLLAIGCRLPADEESINQVDVETALADWSASVSNASSKFVRKPTFRHLVKRHSSFTEIAVNEYYLARLPIFNPNKIDIIDIHLEGISQDETCRIDISYPQIQRLGNLEVEAKINQHLEDLFLDRAAHPEALPRSMDVEACARKLAARTAAWQKQGRPQATWQYFASGDYVVSFNAANILSIRADGFISDLSPSAHPMKHRAWAVIDLRTGDPYQCDDLFKADEASKHKLARLMERPPELICFTFSIAEDGLVIAPSLRHIDFGWTETLMPVFLQDFINPDGPLRVFLPEEYENNSGQIQ